MVCRCLLGCVHENFVIPDAQALISFHKDCSWGGMHVRPHEQGNLLPTALVSAREVASARVSEPREIFGSIFERASLVHRYQVSNDRHPYVY